MTGLSRIPEATGFSRWSFTSMTWRRMSRVKRSPRDHLENSQVLDGAQLVG
jgi:hypothetical protein